VGEVLVVENGTAVICDGSSIRVDARFASGVVPVGARGVALDSSTLRARAELARYGMATVALALDHRGALLGAPSIVTRGIANMDDPSVSRALKGAIGRALERAQKRRLDVDELREEVRRAIRRELYDIGGTKPVVDVHIIEDE
jgi:ribonuclease J